MIFRLYIIFSWEIIQYLDNIWFSTYWQITMILHLIMIMKKSLKQLKTHCKGINIKKICKTSHKNCIWTSYFSCHIFTMLYCFRTFFQYLFYHYGNLILRGFPHSISFRVPDCTLLMTQIIILKYYLSTDLFVTKRHISKSQITLSD